MADPVSLAVHRCRFVDYHPSAITALAFPPNPLPKSNTKAASTSTASAPAFGILAVGHANGNIDLCEWAGERNQQQCPQAWVVKQTLPGLYPSKVDSLVFALKNPTKCSVGSPINLSDLRLFSSGGGSELLEWDLSRGCIRRTISSQSGSIWAVAANPASTSLALGCEDGSVRLLRISEDTLYHQKRFDRVKCRILSVAWGPPILSEQHQQGESDGSEDEELEWQDSWLVTGGSDSALRKWDVKAGRVMERMATDKARGERTLVWTIATMGDGTIISGDSLGTVKFWDHRTCTQLHSFKGHGADVLCLAVGPGGTSVFSAGVDQKITQYFYVKTSKTVSETHSKTSGRWVQSSSRRLHSHDVRALAIWPPHTALPKSHRISPPSDISPVLASGGLDMSVTLTPCASPQTTATKTVNPLGTSLDSTFDESYHRRVSYMSGVAARSGICVARKARLMMSMSDSEVTIWKIALKPTPAAEEAPEDKESDGWERVLQMSFYLQTNLIAGAISDDGHWLVVSDQYETKLFLLDSNSDSIVPRRIRNFPSLLQEQLSDPTASTGSVAIAFTPDSSKLVLSTAFLATLIVIDLQDELSPQILKTFDQHRAAGTGRRIKPKESESSFMSNGESNSFVPSSASRLAISADGQWLVSSDMHCNTFVFHFDSLQYHCALPSFSQQVQALSFDPSRPNLLLLTFPNNSLQIYDVEARQFPSWSRDFVRHLHGRLSQIHDHVVGMALDSSPSSSPPYALLWGSTWICKVELDDSRRGGSAKKRARDVGAATATKAEPKGYKIITHYRPLIFVDFIAPGELIVVERPLVDVLAALPPAYFRHKYGAS